MAKKKATRRSNGDDNGTPQTHNQKAPETDKKPTAFSRQSSMEGNDFAEEKVQNLKSLNAILVKQTVEKRQQIDSLVQVKDELEIELARYGSEKTGLQEELDQVSDVNFGLNMELALVMDYVGNGYREMGVEVQRLMSEKDDKESEIKGLKREANEIFSKVEIERENLRKVCEERDSIKNGFELQREEVNRLKEIVIRLEEKESNLELVIGKLKSENDKLVKQGRMREEMVEEINKEKTDLEKSMEEKKKEIEELKREIKVLLGVKNEMEIEKINQRGEIENLEKTLDKLNVTVESLTKEERELQDLVIKLEKNRDEYMEKEIAMTLQIDALRKEKTIKESELESVMEEKRSVEKQMEILKVQSSEKEKLINKFSLEKIELEECTFSQETKLVDLNQKVDELTHNLAMLQKDCNDRTKTGEKLSCKVGELREALEQAELKREKAVKKLDEEKRQGEELKVEVLNSGKMIKSTLEELEEVKIENLSLFAVKKDLENQFELLKSEKITLEKDLVEVKRAMEAMKTELKSAGMDAKRSLLMLKTTASMVSQSENQENETESYAVELESIEKAFKNKEDMIEEMKKEAKTMKQSKEDSDKKKSFWTFVSSITTIFAAASFAYASRTR